MTLPTPDKDYSATMDDADWTKNGSPTFSNDLWNNLSALNGDGVDNALQQSAIITSADGSKHTISFWMKADSVTGNEDIYTQGAQGGSINNPKLIIFADPNDSFTILAATSNGNGLTGRSNSAITILDGTYHHHMIAFDGVNDDIDMFVDGVEVGYTVQDQVTGAGYSGVPVGIDDTIVGSDIVPSLFIGPTMSVTRLKVWRTNFASAAEALEEYNSEVASQSDNLSGSFGTHMLLPTLFG